MIENVTNAPNIEDRANYLTLLNRWKAGNYELIDTDYDYIKIRGDVKKTTKYKEAQKPDLALLKAINDAVGIRELLSEERKAEAVEEWLAGDDDLSDLEANPPQTYPELLVEVEKMYQGETKYTEKRVKKIVAIMNKNPDLKAKFNKYVIPFPAGPGAYDAYQPVEQAINVKRSYESFHQYIEKIVAPVVQKQPSTVDE